jgi:hypothetical protein
MQMAHWLKHHRPREPLADARTAAVEALLVYDRGSDSCLDLPEFDALLRTTAR